MPQRLQSPNKVNKFVMSGRQLISTGNNKYSSMGHAPPINNLAITSERWDQQKSEESFGSGKPYLLTRVPKKHGQQPQMCKHPELRACTFRRGMTSRERPSLQGRKSRCVIRREQATAQPRGALALRALLRSTSGWACCGKMYDNCRWVLPGALPLRLAYFP